MSTTVSREAANRFELSELATKHVFRRLIPFLLLMYVIAFLDRSNLAFAQDQFKINNGISASAYALGAGLFFAGYAIFEIPSNIMLHKVGARWWLARIMVSWGIVSACFMFVNGTTSFYVLRILLGIAEAGFFPGVILFLTYWVPGRHLNRARGIFYMGIALAGIIGNPLSGSLLELDGFAGLRGTQWMFLAEGLLAVAVGVAAVHAGHKVQYFTAADLTEALYRGMADNSVGRVIENLLRNDLILLDEVGFAPLDDTGAQLLFRFVSAAYERRALGVASHWPFDQWGRFLPEHTTAVSLLDRLLHHASIVVTDGESYRMREARSRGGTIRNKN